MPVNQYWNMTSANWYSGRTLTCSGCHGTAVLPNGEAAAFESVAGEPAYVNLTGQGQRNSHNRHITRTGIADSSGCAKCHATTVDGSIANKLRDYSSAHLDRTRTVAFLPSLQGRYSTASQECLNLYCHSPGNKASSFDPPMQSARWGSTLRTDCSGCHKGNAASFRWMSSGSHNRHVSPNPWAPYRIDCAKCHASTVNPGMNIKDFGKHVSGTLEIAYDNTSTAVNGKYAGSFAPVSKNPGSGYGSCLLYTSPSPRDRTRSRMPSSA
jgi:predicted CxxxxCH...CXXCH cytochrome family protein